jgi:hypothetical protein
MRAEDIKLVDDQPLHHWQSVTLFISKQNVHKTVLISKVGTKKMMTDCLLEFRQNLSSSVLV